ncbi:hypothetical protein E1B06_18450 [Brevibacillus laterosporus]|uniref:hypothetical protein n=1 Tax=Brevibacillus laterosporus TaxID=1465 RepID=UPI0024059801|nr:hypothetical protein [Brevibacillus laterosporus]MDF9413650.1 hypothetical protein [Brevibacillus laterosporus]
MLSRSKKEKKRRNKERKRIFLGFVSLSMCFGLTMGVAYADVDVTQLLQGWYAQSTEVAKQSVTDALKTETQLQKERLKAEIQRKLLESAEDLKQFTVEEKAKRLTSLADYAGDLIDNLDISNEKDRRQVERKMDAILSSAQQAMRDLADSYEAPSLEFVPTKPTPSQPPVQGGAPVPTPEVPPAPNPSKPQPEPNSGEPQQPSPKPNPSEPQQPEPAPKPSEPQQPEPAPKPSEPQQPEPAPKPSEPQQPEPAPKPSEPQQPEPAPEQHQEMPQVSVTDEKPISSVERPDPIESQERPADIPDPANAEKESLPTP